MQFCFTVPPDAVKLIQENTELSLSKFITSTCACYVISANPCCNISWVYPGSLVNENYSISGNELVGFNTTSFITFNTSTDSDDDSVVTCNPLCGKIKVMSMTINLTIPVDKINDGKIL